MSRTTLLRGAVCVSVLAAGCGVLQPGPQVALQDFGAYRIGAALAPDPPTTGENAMTVVVRDAAGKPVTGAAVDVVVSMPAMGAMPYMESRARVTESRGGAYRARFGLSMAGDWDVALAVAPPGAGPLRSAWRLSTNTKGLTLVSGGRTPPATAGGVPDTAATRSALAAGAAPGEVAIDPARRQQLGVRIDAIAERELAIEIRAAGRIAYDETRLAEVSPRVSGWVRAVRADFTGRAVRRGDVLCELYSPDAYAAQQEFLQALRAAREDSARGIARDDLADAARRRLALWGLARADIAAIERSGRARETFPVHAPVSGVVTEKTAVLGAPVTAGQVLYRIAPIDPVWVLASVFEQDLPLVHAGAPATLVAAGLGERRGRVAFVAPDVSPDTRTGTVRITVPNPRGELKPGAYADVRMHVPLGRRLAVPESAVLPTGERRLVFVDLGDGRLAPREVALGAKAGGWYEVRGGLAAGDRVVTSGNFLVAAESRLRSATGKW